MMVYGIEGDGDGIKAVYLGDPQKGQFFSPRVLKMELKHPVYNRHSGLESKKIITIRPVGKYDCVVTSQQEQGEAAALLHKSITEKEFRTMLMQL